MMQYVIGSCAYLPIRVGSLDHDIANVDDELRNPTTGTGTRKRSNLQMYLIDLEGHVHHSVVETHLLLGLLLGGGASR
jgi:hypothetical protein